MFDLNVLRSELSGESYSGLSDSAAAARLNERTVPRLRPISSAELLAWSAIGGRFVRLEQAAESAELSVELRSVVKVALKLIERDGTSLDLNLPDRQMLLGVLVAGGILSASESTELTSLATELVSRAEELGLGEVLPGHVEQARLE